MTPQKARQQVISIHAPRGGSDYPRYPRFQPPGRFQSTLPVGGATLKGFAVLNSDLISIHAPRGGSDRSPVSRCSRSPDFNPRSPWGERLAFGHPVVLRKGISIHAPRGGSDAKSRADAILYFSFQSTLPVGGATSTNANADADTRNFNPRSPWGERQPETLHPRKRKRFQSTLPVGGATHQPCAPPSPSGDFNPRSPWGERRFLQMPQALL